MIIKLYDIEDEVAVKGGVETSRFLREGDDIAFLSPIAYELTVRRFGGNVRINGPVRAALTLVCDRCLEPFAFSVDTYLDVELAPRQEAPDAHELELSKDEMDLEYYEGEEIDLDPYVYEEVMLGVPIKALCSGECRGICPQCGQNRNEKECDCGKSNLSSLGEKLNLMMGKQAEE